MSLVGTLAKVAIGVAIAKGVGSVMQGARQGGGMSAGQAGTGSTFGGASSPRMAGAGSAGGLEDIMKSVLGGAPSAPGGASPLPGGLGGLLEQLSAGTGTGGAARGAAPAGGIGGLLEQLAGAAGGATAGGSAGGLGDLLGQLTGQRPGTAGPAGQAGAGGLGDLLGGLLGAAAGGAATNGKSFGDVLNQSLQNMGEPEVAPTPHQEAAAALMLRAMIQAAKSDGSIDAAEKAKLTQNLDGASEAEMRFVRELIAAPVDVEALVRDTPEGLGAQVYTMSVMAIALDNQQEANYLHALATGLGIPQQAVNQIHAQLGVPALYT